VTGEGPLALVGGDELNPGNEAVDRFLVDAGRGGPAFVLTTAAARHRPDLAVRHAQAWFGSLGLEVEELPVLRRSQANDPGVARLASTGRFFYLVGGDPAPVVRVLAGTTAWGAAVAAWRGGAALAGSSAGAMALGAWSLIRDRWPNPAGRRFLEALDVASNVAVVPHFETFGHGWLPSVRDHLPRPEAVLLGLDERTGAVWHGGRWTARGPGRVTVIVRDREHAFENGETVDGVPSPTTSS
jgi:cyanophycinase